MEVESGDSHGEYASTLDKHWFCDKIPSNGHRPGRSPSGLVSVVRFLKATSINATIADLICTRYNGRTWAVSSVG